MNEILTSSRAQLRERMCTGYAVDPDALAESVWLGVSLGLPGWAERLTWKTFSKCFRRHAHSGRLTGWNVRLRQNALAGPPVPLLRRGVPYCFGGFEVVDRPLVGPAADMPVGISLDYSRGGNGWWNPISLLRDPLVALGPESGAPMLGWSWLALGPGVGTPSYFVLSRLGTIADVGWDMRR